jgi:alpha-glucosidase
MSGVPFCGVDIGGFAGSTDAELLMRWYQLGIFYPFCRNHCALGGRAQEPWAFGPSVVKALRRLIEIRYQLLPYLQQLFVEHRRTGAPLMRPLAWHYPDDVIASEIDDQFMLGADILVAPILSRGKTQRAVYLPEGHWFKFQGGPALPGGRYHQVSWAFDRAPAFVKEGAILPIADIVQHSAELAHAPLTFRCFGDRAKGQLWQDDGISLGYERDEYNEWKLFCNRGRFTAQGVHQGYQAPTRRYYYEIDGNKRPLKNWPPAPR